MKTAITKNSSVGDSSQIWDNLIKSQVKTLKRATDSLKKLKIGSLSSETLVLLNQVRGVKPLTEDQKRELTEIARAGTEAGQELKKELFFQESNTKNLAQIAHKVYNHEIK